MGLLIRAILAAAGAVATLLLAPDTANFGIVQAMIGLGLIAALLVVLALWRR